MAIFGAALFKSSLVAIAALWTLAFLIYGIIVNTDHVGALILGVIWNAFIIYVSVSFSSPQIQRYVVCFIIIITDSSFKRNAIGSCCLRQ